jgi:Uncharacterised nucleotidyltransferase
VLFRREPLTLPYAYEVPLLAGLLRGASIVEPVGDRFIEAAVHHRVGGFVLAAGARGRVELPAAQREELAARFAVMALHSALLRSELPTVVAALDAAGSAPVLIKGPVIADRYYPDPGLRTFADLDLLVQRERLGAAVGALAEAGYEQLLEFRPGFGERHGHDVHVVRRIGNSRVDVELHWRIGDDPVSSALDWGRLRSGEHRLPLNGCSVAVAGPAEQLLVLAVHLLSDRAKRLVWIEDLVLAGGAAAEDEWERAFELAGAAGLSWVLHRSLDYAAAVLAFDRARPLPAGPPPPWGPLRAVETLDLGASTHVGRLAILEWRGRTRYLRDVLVPTRAGLEGTVGGDGAPLWRLAGRHARSVIRGAAPQPS